MNYIVAVDDKWGIGKNNQLLARIPSDLAYFKEVTLGKIVVMGRKTFESLPKKKPLKDRINIVLSEQGVYTDEMILQFGSISDLENYLKHHVSNDIYIIGGGQIYQALYNQCKLAYITKIIGDYQADTFVPNIDLEENWQIIWESDIQTENNIQFQWLIYRNTNIKIEEDLE